MNIGQYELNIKRRSKNRKNKSELAKTAKGKGIQPGMYGGKVGAYSQVTAKTFGTYKTVGGDTALTYDIVEGLYRRTIMHKVINKMSGDAARLGFKVIYTDMDGNPHEKAAELGKEIDRLITRNLQKYMYRDRNVYGDAFIYIQEGKSATGNTNIQDMYLINPRNLQPVEKDSTLGGWTYQSGAGENIELSPEEVLHIPREPLTQELYGISCFEPVLQILNLILNSHLNAAVILDHFAIPIIHWRINSKHDRRKTPLPEIKNFIDSLKTMAIGNDLVTDDSITSERVGGTHSAIDFSPMLDKLDDYFFATTGVPGSILGMEADNLSAITRQLQTYYDNIFDEQMTSFDYLIYGLYWPQMLEAGYDDLYSISFTSAKPLVEQESRIMTWVEKAINMGLIDRPEGRSAIGYMGPPPEEIDKLEQPFQENPFGVPTNDENKGPDFDKKQKQEKPPGTNPE